MSREDQQGSFGPSPGGNLDRQRTRYRRSEHWSTRSTGQRLPANAWAVFHVLTEARSEEELLSLTRQSAAFLHDSLQVLQRCGLIEAELLTYAEFTGGHAPASSQPAVEEPVPAPQPVALPRPAQSTATSEQRDTGTGRGVAIQILPPPGTKSGSGSGSAEAGEASNDVSPPSSFAAPPEQRPEPTSFAINPANQTTPAAASPPAAELHADETLPSLNRPKPPGYRMQPLIAHFESVKETRLEAQLAVFKTFNRVPREHIARAGLSGLPLNQTDLVIRDAQLWQAILVAAREVLGSELPGEVLQGAA